MSDLRGICPQCSSSTCGYHAVVPPLAGEPGQGRRQDEHNAVRTVPTDGQWCNRCGIPAADWSHEPCPGFGAAEFVEQKLIAARTELFTLRERMDAGLAEVDQMYEGGEISQGGHEALRAALTGGVAVSS